MRPTSTYVLTDERRREMAIGAVKRAPLGMEVIIQEETRSTEQNKRWWSMLGALAKSDLTFDGELRDAEEWHDILLHAFLTHKKLETGTSHRGLYGGAVILGRLSSKRLNKKLFGELMDLTIAFIDTNQVYWAERAAPPPEDDDQYEAYRR